MALFTIYTVVGARPQFVKAAALSRAVMNDPRFTEKLINTDQHYDANMAQVFFEDLEIPAPAYSLGINGGSHGAMTGQMLIDIEKIFLDSPPDAVIIFGDTNSTLAAALAAAKIHIPVVHIEAGLRSYNKTMPEEINRILSDHVSALCLCPTQQAIDNLAKENVTDGVSWVGDIMYDTTLFAMEKAKAHSEIIQTLDIEPKTFDILTLHRQANTKSAETLSELIDYVNVTSEAEIIVFPVHPRTQNILEESGLNLGKIRMIDPLGGIDFHSLLSNSNGVFTDSGGLQKEAYFHRKACVTLRPETEWTETIEAGWNRLWKTPEFKTPRQDIDEYGDGKTAEACLDAIAKLLTQRPA